MAALNLADFFIDIYNTNDDILKLMKSVQPGWDPKDINIKASITPSIIGGYSSSVYRVYVHNKRENSVIVRIRNLFSYKEIIGLVDSDFEKKVVQVVSTLGIFSKVFAFFKNGYCYQYIEGQPLININLDSPATNTSVDIKNLPIKLIAKKLAEIHCVKIDGEDYSKTTFFDIMSKTLETKYPDVSRNSALVDKNIIRKEHAELLSYLKNFNLNIVLCHGDPNCTNMVWDKKEDKLTLIDWEQTYIGYQAYDVGYFPMSLTFLEFTKIPGLPIYDRAVVKQQRDNFVREYLEEYFRLRTGNSDVPEDYYREFDRQVKLFSLIWLVNTHIIIGACMKENAEKSNMLPDSFKYYMEIKDEMLNDLNLTNI